MSRSFKKPYIWISKKWDRFKERAFRRKTKMQLDEIKWDPDKDWLEAQVKSEYGTKCGWDFQPAEFDDTWMHEDFEKSKRK